MELSPLLAGGRGGAERPEPASLPKRGRVHPFGPPWVTSSRFNRLSPQPFSDRIALAGIRDKYRKILFETVTK